MSERKWTLAEIREAGDVARLSDGQLFVLSNQLERLPAEPTLSANEMRLRAALKEVAAKNGMCVFGASEMPEDPEQAFRLGSAYAFNEAAEIASEALGGGE